MGAAELHIREEVSMQKGVVDSCPRLAPIIDLGTAGYVLALALIIILFETICI